LKISEMILKQSPISSGAARTPELAMLIREAFLRGISTRHR